MKRPRLFAWLAVFTVTIMLVLAACSQNSGPPKEGAKPEPNANGVTTAEQ